MPTVKVFTQGEYEFRPDHKFKWWEVEVVGGGGGGGGAPKTGLEQGAGGGGGAGGGYSRAYGVISALPAVVKIVVGRGGDPGMGAAPNETTHRGGDSKFGTFAKGQGGRGGGASPASTKMEIRLGGSPGIGTKGYLNVSGQPGEPGLIAPGGKPSRGGQGGHSVLGSGGRTPHFNSDGRSPLGGYGGGGSGASNGPNQTADRTGGRGAPGVVILKLYEAT